MGKEAHAGFRQEVRQRVAEPVRARAEQRVPSNISNVGGKWSRIKSGVTGATAYIAPAARRSGGSPRANLGRLLFREMSEALDEKRPEVIKGYEEMLDRLAVRHGF